MSKEISALIKKYNSGMLHGVGHQLRGRAAFAIRMAMSEEHLPEEAVAVVVNSGTLDFRACKSAFVQVFCQMVASSVDMRFNDTLLEMRGFYIGMSMPPVLHLESM